MPLTPGPPPTGGLPPGELARLLGRAAARRGIELRDRPEACLARGLARRLAHGPTADLPGYLRQLDNDGDEIHHLLDALALPVTGFFRDPPVWAALAGVLPDLQGLFGSALRVWVPGVATGEEAWTLAMLLAGPAGPSATTLLASDRDGQALAVARAASYPRQAVDPVPPALRARFIDVADRGAVITPTLRTRVDFVAHDLLGPTVAPAPAVLAAFHLISLRNVLIYFARWRQALVLAGVVRALRPGGVLILGPCESLTAASAAQLEVYPGLPAPLRIFRRLPR